MPVVDIYVDKPVPVQDMEFTFVYDPAMVGAAFHPPDSSPATPRRRVSHKKYVAQLVVAFMQLYACILALPGGYEALQPAQN